MGQYPDLMPLFHFENEHHTRNYIQRVHKDVHDHADINVLLLLGYIDERKQPNCARHDHPGSPNVEQCEENTLNWDRPHAKMG